MSSKFQAIVQRLLTLYYDNVPTGEGEARYYFYDSRSSGAVLDGKLQSDVYPSPGDGVKNIGEVDNREHFYYSTSDDGLFVKRVEYGRAAVTVSIAEQDRTGFESAHSWTSLDGYDELYYSSYEYAGSSGEEGLC